MVDDRTILDLRSEKKVPDPFRPYRFLQEQEPWKDGTTHPVNTIFLTGSECPFKCVMCDLWKHTLDGPTPAGSIPEQIRYALSELPKAAGIKLYNNGNFFDKKAVPESDYAEISSLLGGYDNVIVENHPRLCGEAVPRFREMLNTSLEVALGLETIHPDILPRLNKQVTTENFASAVRFLHNNRIRTRAFVLLNPPFLTGPGENISWCLKSIGFAFDEGVETCSIIPTRGGNGIMDNLQKNGEFMPPTLFALEEVIDEALSMKRGCVLADIWDLRSFSDCEDCIEERINRLNMMNLQQIVLPRVSCHCSNPDSEGECDENNGI